MNKYQQRINNLRAVLKNNGLDAIYLTDQYNVSYFMGRNGYECYLYISMDNAYIITDFRYYEMAQSMKEWLTLDMTQSGHSIVDILQSKPEHKVGIEKNNITLNEYMILNSKLKDKELVPVADLVAPLRMIKDEDEIEATKKACDIAKQTYIHMLDVLKPGMEEIEAAAELEHYMRKLGASGTSFDTILITGKKTSLPHGVPGHEKIKAGDFVTMDFGCKVDGYCSDMTRTVAVGNPTDEMKEVYDIVLRAQLNAINNIKAGVTGKEADAFARDIIADAGYGKYFGHSLGHGTGLFIHEEPRYSPNNNETILAGSIVSIEPGIYLPEKFGVRIEDLALVTDNGIIDFEDAPKQLTIL